MRHARILCLLALLALTPPSAAADLRPFAPGTLSEIVAGHAGRPLVILLWSISCSICVAELPEWGRFVAETRGSGAEVVLINWDRRGDETRIRRFLDKAGLGDRAGWLLGSGFEERLRVEIDPEWMGELPYTRLVSAAGASSSFTGSADFSGLKGWLTTEARR